MRKLLVVSAMTAVCVPALSLVEGTLLAQSALTQDNPPQTISAARRADPPKGPVPRLPGGQPDLEPGEPREVNPGRPPEQLRSAPRSSDPRARRIDQHAVEPPSKGRS